MQRLTLLIVPMLIAIALFIGISSYETAGSSTGEESTLASLDFDAYSEGINTVLYDSNGSINYTLQAVRQTHFNDDTTEFEKPFIRLYQDGASQWNIIAESGRILAAQADSADQTIELSGDVEVYSLDDFGNRTVMSTQFLSVDPQAETMETDLPVTLVTTNVQQSSIGMNANLEIDEIVFHRNIRGKYEQLSDQ